jgi:hypothetical protein
VLLASLVTGFFGGFGFATATLFKLIEVKSGWQTNWHSVLEQTYGFINGVGIAAALLLLRSRVPKPGTEAPVPHWTNAYAVAFLLLGITYVNLRKNPGEWVKANAVPATLAGLSAETWFNLAYLALAALCLAALILHQRRPLPLLPNSAAGKAQLLYVVFLWWMVVGNLERALVSFAPERLVTEGVIHFNAVLCSGLALLCRRVFHVPATVSDFPRGFATRVAALGLAALGLAASLLSIVADWAIVRAAWGDQFAGHAGLHFRFGPNATATKEKPASGQRHP